MVRLAARGSPRLRRESLCELTLLRSQLAWLMASITETWRSRTSPDAHEALAPCKLGRLLRSIIVGVPRLTMTSSSSRSIPPLRSRSSRSCLNYWVPFAIYSARFLVAGVHMKLQLLDDRICRNDRLSEKNVIKWIALHTEPLPLCPSTGPSRSDG